MTDLFTELPHGVRFAEKWAEWIVYKAQIKDGYKSPKSAAAMSKKLSRYSEEVAIQMIDESIANGYKGIFPLKTNGKQVEPTQVYKELPQPKVSTEPARKFDPEDGKNFIIERIRKAYHKECSLNDVGEVYTNRLKHLLSTPEDVKQRLTEEVTKEANIKPRNRFEEKIEINIPLECRNRILAYNLNQWRDKQKEIWKEL